MIKRFSIIFLVLVFSLSLFLIPVSATGTSDGSYWLTNLLEYTTIDSLDNTFNFAGSITHEIEVPFSTTVNYVDIVMFCSGGTPTVSWNKDAQESFLTVESIGSNVYRCYGNVTNRQSQWFYLTIASPSSSTVYCTLYQLNVGRYQMASSSIAGTLNLSYPSVITTTMDSPTIAASLVVPNVSSSSKYVDFGGYITVSDWRKFDTLDILLNVDSTTINSFSAQCGSNIVPIDIQYLEGNVPEFDSSIGDSTSSVSVLRYVRVSLDLSGLNRSEVSSLQLNFSGLYDGYQSATLTLYRVTGHVLTNTVDAPTFWLRRLWLSVTDGFDRIADLLNPDSTVVDDSINQADQAITDIHDMEQQYASDLDSSLISGEVSKVENYGNALVFCGSVLSRTFSQLQGYQIIYILPICVGLFLFVASRARPIHVPRQHSAPKANDTQVLDNKGG